MCLVSNFQKNDGRFRHKYMKNVWKDYADLHEWLLKLTEEFDLTFPLPKESTNLVPCLLPVESPASVGITSIYSDIPTTQGKHQPRAVPSACGESSQCRYRVYNSDLPATQGKHQPRAVPSACGESSQCRYRLYI